LTTANGKQPIETIYKPKKQNISHYDLFILYNKNQIFTKFL